MILRIHIRPILLIACIVTVGLMALIWSNNADRLRADAQNTPVSGIINADTTWDAAGSPYNLVGHVQIASDATLTIGPGVTVNGNNYRIEVFGAFAVAGTAAQNAILNDIQMQRGTSDGFVFDIRHSQINRGALYAATGGGGSGSLLLRDSTIRDLESYLYLWYPNADCFIERNIFIRSPGFSVGTSGTVKVYIRNNVFYQWPAVYNEHFTVHTWADYDDSDTIVEFNSFLNTDRVALRGMRVAVNNFFNTTDTAVIDSMIFDRNDDLNERGVILYQPFLSEPHPDTPSFTAPPPATSTATPTPTDETPTSTPTATFPPDAPTGTPTATSVPPGVTPRPVPGDADIYEPNDRCEDAGVIVVDGAPQHHNFHVPGDRDWVRFNVESGQQYRIEVVTGVDSIADVEVELYPSCDQAPVEVYQPTFTPNIIMDFTAVTTGRVYVRLANGNSNSTGNTDYTIAVRRLTDTAGEGAVILVAGRYRLEDVLQDNIHYITNHFYNHFKSLGYTDDNILYLSTDNRVTGVNRPATTDALQRAITEWAPSRLSAGQQLTLVLVDHGDIEQFYLDEPNGQRFTPVMLDQWLTQLEAEAPGIKIAVFIEACYAGSFINAPRSISKPGRMIIASTNAGAVAYASRDGAYFSDHFLTSLRAGYGLNTSFWAAHDKVRQLFPVQEPWIDVNGNQIPNEPADGAGMEEFTFGDTPASVWAPYIVRTQASAKTGQIVVEARDDKRVASVYAVVYSPSYQPPQDSRELQPDNAPNVSLTAIGGDLYIGEYEFKEEGEYRVAVFALDDDGFLAQEMVVVSTLAQDTRIFIPALGR